MKNVVTIRPKLVIQVEIGEISPVNLYNVVSVNEFDEIRDLTGGVPFLDIDRAIRYTEKKIYEANQWLKT